MGIEGKNKVRIVKPDEIVWEEAMRQAGETDPPGEESTLASSGDERFSFGIWRRDVQRRHFERSYLEVAVILEGAVEITDDDGEVMVAEAGDIVVTPMGSKGFWKNLAPTRKIWAIYEDSGADMPAYTGPGQF